MNIGLVVTLQVGVLFILLGILMPLLRQNKFIGSRTPWRKTHRLGGLLCPLAGLLIIVLGLVTKLPALAIVLPVTLLTLAVLILYSYMCCDTATAGVAAPTYFEEEQRVTRDLIVTISLLGILPTLPFIGVMFIFILRQPSLLLLLVGLFVVVLTVLPTLLVYKMKLTIRVDSEYLHIRFSPFISKHIPLNDISEWKVRTYNAWSEYMGHGIRVGSRGRGMSYTVKGNRGVQLLVTGGKLIRGPQRLLLGSQRAEELAQAITAAKKSSDRW